MKRLVAILATIVALVQANDPQFDKQVSSDFLDKQEQILDIFSEISTHNLDSKFKGVRQEITFNNPALFTDPKVLDTFMRAYKRGMIPRDGIFTLNDYKSRHDTFSLFEIMFFAKDFDTFMKIAKWGKDELNSMQFAYAFSVTLKHRADCRGIYLPSSYELYPHYFVPSEIMRQADIAALEDVDDIVFEVNSTGFEHSFYRDTISGSLKSHARWVGDDVESRISYFREDPGLNHWYATIMAWLATWLSPTKHPGVTFIKRGEILYQTHKWYLSRYNLERMSSDMPFVLPFNWNKPVVGYNPRLSDHLGRPFTSRPNNMVPFEFNPAAFKYIRRVEGRMHESIDCNCYWDFKNNSVAEWVDEGTDLLGKMIFGERDGIGRHYYRPWFFLMLEAINDMTQSSNEREYSNTVFGNFMTISRDPVFFQVLSAMDIWFQKQHSSKKPYTPQQLIFPGVKIKGVEFDKLLTYFERWEYEITQGVAFKNRQDRQKKKYLASQLRLNHKPYNFNITIESDRDQDAMIRLSFGPKYYIDGNEMSLDQARHAYSTSLMFAAKLKTGVNVIRKSSEEFYQHEQYESLSNFKRRLNKHKTSGKPFVMNAMINCGLPSNLVIPRGSEGGREYKVFVMAEPVAKVNMDGKQYTHCNLHQFLAQHKMTFPLDRPVPFPQSFIQPNIMFADVTIYHKYQSQYARPSAS